ncbi:MaoC family dehydratase [Microbaculum marinum]|uniref:MaoC family dehydratase n=1 Tax=Microbaculum marinum TaxID=1764581 RepID=A0AAW9RH71_9HYPH
MAGFVPEVGTEFRLAPRPMTRERMRWYVDAQPTVAADDGRIHTQDPTIHDDDDYARKQGLPGIIADGMISTNWIMGLLVDLFGRGVAERCRLRTKYIAPIYEDQVVVTCARVSRVARDADGVAAISLDVWCEDDTAGKLTVGEATVFVAG